MQRTARPVARPALVALALTAALALAGPLRAQQPTPAPASPPGPEVGQMAPDFTLPGATRYGRLRDSVRLADFNGRTVVLAFFPRARTGG